MAWSYIAVCGISIRQIEEEGKEKERKKEKGFDKRSLVLIPAAEV